MEKELLFALISTIIYMVGAIPYWKDVINGRTIPHVFSAWVWLILVWINVHVLWKNEEYYSLIPSVIMFFSLIFWTIFGIFLIKKVQINWFDYGCLVISLLMLLYYFTSNNILYTVIFTAIIDFLAFLPTFKKWWLQPWTESILIYILAWVNQIFTLMALTSLDWENTIFWWYIFFANLAFFFMVAFRRWYLKGWNSIFE